MKNKQRKKKNRSRSKLAVLVLGVLLLVIFALKFTPFFAIASSQVLNLEGVTTDGSWFPVEVRTLNTQDEISIETSDIGDRMQINLMAPPNCQGTVTAINGEITPFFSDITLGLQLTLNNESSVFVYSDDLVEGSYEFTFNSKSDGSPWTCDDLETPSITVLAVGENDAEREIETVWGIDALSISADIIHQEPEISVNSFYWDSLSDNNNLSPKNSLVFQTDIGSKAIISYLLKNKGTIDSGSKSHSLQYAEVTNPSTCKTEETEWMNLSDKSPISIGNIGDKYEVPNLVECAEDCEEIIGSSSDHQKYYSFKANSTQQLNFPIDTKGADPTMSYCIRLVTTNEDTGEYDPVDSDLDHTYIQFQTFQKENKVDPKINTAAKIVNEKKYFNGNQNPKFVINAFEPIEPTTIESIDQISGKRVISTSKYSIFGAIYDASGIEIDGKVELLINPNGELTIELPKQYEFEPGHYRMQVDIETSGSIETYEYEFLWGVLAVNTDQDIYRQNEEAKVMMTVLDDMGKTICDADVQATVISPIGEVRSYSTFNGTIAKSDQCGPDNFTYEPDFYFTHQITQATGEYVVEMSSIVDGVERTIEQTFVVEEDPAFIIGRTSATRIYPVEAYEMGISIYSRDGYTGKVVDYLPTSFEVSNSGGQITSTNSYKEVAWTVNIKPGETIQLGYKFDAPDISPEFYTVGPLSIGSSTEKRTWQIASDALTNKYAVTCTGWTTPANAQGSPTLADTAVFSSFTTSNSASNVVSLQNSISCSGFDSTSLGTFSSANVVLSLAADGTTGDNDTTAITYDVNGGGQNTLTTITHDAQRSNSTNGGYWSYSAPNITSWTDVGNTTVYLNNDKVQGPDNNNIYLDAVWVEVTYTTPTITVSGTCKEYNETTDCTSGTVRIAVDGSLAAQTGTITSGTWTITGVTAPGTGGTLIAFIDGATDPNEAVAVTTYDGSGNITGVPLIKEHLVIGSDENRTVTNADLADYDNVASGDEDIFYEVDGSNNLTVDYTTQSTQEVLYIESGNTYQPAPASGVTVNTHDLDNNGTIDLDGNTLKLSGSWDNNSTFTADTSTVTFIASSGAETVDSTGGTGAFNTVNFGETSGTAEWDLSSTLDINGAASINYGTLDMNGANNITLANNLTIGSSGSYTKGSGTMTFDGSTTQTITDNQTTKDDLGSVRFNTTAHTVQLGSSIALTDIIIPTNITFDMTTNGYTMTVLGNGAGTSRPFYINGGTFTAGTNSTVTYRSDTDLEVQSTTYDNLVLENPTNGQTPTHTLGSGTSQTITADTLTIGEGSNTITANAETYDPTINVTSDFTINGNATYSASSTGTMNISGDWTNNGTFTDNSSTITFNSTSTGNTISGNLTGTSQFYKVIFDGNGGGWTITNAMSVSADVTDAMDVSQGVVTVGDGNADDLTVLGNLSIGSSSSAATLQTPDSLAQGNTVTININSTTPTACTNCTVDVGTTTDADPTGSLIINENGILRFNSDSSVASGLNVNDSGSFQVTGLLSDSGTAGSGTNDTSIEDSSKSWTNNEHQNKHLLITSGYSAGQVHLISGNDNNTINITDSFPTTDTGGSFAPATDTFTSSVSLITTTGDAEGYFLYNVTQGLYSRIVDTTNNGTTDSIVIADSPNTFAYTSGDSVTISYGILNGDGYEILDYAHVTGSRGTLCDADDTTNYHGYITSAANSETTIVDSEVCDLGANTVNKYGITASSINEDDANEGFSISDSYLHSNYSAVSLSSSTGVVISGNTIEYNSTAIDLTSSTNNVISTNEILHSSTSGITLTTSSRNTIHHNTIGLSVENISVSGSTTLRIYDNELFGGTKGIEFISSSNDNFIYNNEIYAASSYCAELNVSSGLVSYNSDYYDCGSGFYLLTSTGNMSISDDFGLNHNNTQDIEFSTSTASNLSLYGSDLNSTTEVSGITATNSYVISKDHDPESQTGLTRIWGEYTIPNDVTETVSFDEGTDQFNYADELWTDAISPASYSGTGTEDTDIAITLTSAITQIELYEAEVTTANGDTPVFTITRTGGTASPATYTLPSTYTEAATGVQFTIQDGATNYAVGDKYIFIVGPGSNDINTQKDIEVMQSGDSITVGTGETIEMTGDFGNETVMTGPTGGFGFDVTGEIDATSYEITKLDGTGLNLQSGATITNLSYGSFDESEGSGSTDTYISVAAAVLNTTGAQTYENMTFDETTTSDSNVEYNVTLPTDPSACTNSWTFQNTIGNKNAETDDSDNGDGGACNSGEGYILFTIVTDNAPNPPTALAQKTTSDVVIPTFDWTSETSVKFTASATDPDASDTLALCIEIDQVGTAFSDTEDSCGTPVAYSGTAVDVTHTISGLTDGTEYHWQARTIDTNSNYSTWVSYGGNLETERDVGIDTSAPTSGTVYDGPTPLTDIDENAGSLDEVQGSWSGFADTGSGLKGYEYAIGTTQGGTDIQNWTSVGFAGTLFSDGFESGDFSNWDATSTGGGDLSVSTTQVSLGLYSAEGLVDDAADKYLQDSFTAADELYARFYLYNSAQGLGNGDTIDIISFDSGSTQRAYIEYGRTGSTYFIRGVEGVGASATANVTVTTGQWYYVELHWKAGTSEVVTMTVDGTEYNTTAANSSGLTVNNSKLGTFNITAGATATLYFDDYDSDTTTDLQNKDYMSETVTASGHLHTGQYYYLTVRAVNNAETPSTAANSDGFSVLPTFSFGLDKSSLQFLDLSPSNAWSDSQTISTITSTNAYGGYIVRMSISQPFTNTLYGTYTIANYAGTNATPTVWSGNGFGYTTSDNNLSGGTADRFTNGGPKYAGFTTTGPGDPVADHTTAITGTTGALSNQLFDIGLKVTTDAGQAAGPYSTDIIFVATPTF